MLEDNVNNIYFVIYLLTIIIFNFHENILDVNNRNNSLDYYVFNNNFYIGNL